MAAPDPPAPQTPSAPEPTISPDGFGIRRFFGLAVDEPLAVGEDGLSDAERMRRARDILRNRQFLDRMFNSATKRNFFEQTGRARVLPLVSIVDQPGAIWRPTLENVQEWRDFATFISAKVAPRIAQVKSPGRVKEIINEAIRNELKFPTTDAGRKLNGALKSQTGMEPTELFRPGTVWKVPWGTAVGRKALFNAGTMLAGAVVGYSQDASAASAQQAAREDPRALALMESAGRYRTDHWDTGVLVIQVFEVRKMNEHAAASTTYRYTTVSYGKKEHEALWKHMDEASISKGIDVFSTEYKRYYWLPPLHEDSTVNVNDGGLR